MARNMTPVIKRCRALGLEPAVLGIDKKPSKRKPKVARRKVSEYGVQLREKQKVKFIYGVLEKQFRGYYEKAKKQQGVTGENLMRLLELRMDNVVFRLGFARTRIEARQLVLHGHILLNGKKADIPSMRVKAHDEISIRPKSRKSEGIKRILDDTASRLIPEWLDSNPDDYKGSVLSLPTREQINDIPVNETLIIELYSK